MVTVTGFIDWCKGQLYNPFMTIKVITNLRLGFVPPGAPVTWEALHCH